jgi:hypothetical protein
VSPLILKRASASRPSGQWQDEDYDVIADGKVVGRIYEDASASTPPELRWFWSVAADEPRNTVPATCSKCDGKAAFRRDELIATTGAACPMPSLLERLAAPDCPRCGSNWDRCGVHYVEPIETSR